MLYTVDRKTSFNRQQVTYSFEAVQLLKTREERLAKLRYQVYRADKVELRVLSSQLGCQPTSQAVFDAASLKFI